MENRIISLKNFCFVLILTGLVCVSCEEPSQMGLVIENNAANAYRFTGNFVMVVQAFDTVIQPGENYNYDHSKSSWYGTFEVYVYDMNTSKPLKKTTIYIPKQTEKKTVYLSWDGSNFTK